MTLPDKVKDYHLWWAVGLTLGSYLGSRHPASNCFSTFFVFLIIIFLLLVEFFVVKKFLYTKSKNDIENGINALSRRKVFLKYNSKRKISLLFMIGIIISFFVFSLLGYLSFSMYSLKESKNIFYLICRSKNYDKEGIILEGRVDSHPEFRYGSLYFLLRVDRTLVADKGKNIDVFFKTGDFIKVKLKDSYPSFLLRDDYIRINGNISCDGNICLTDESSNGNKRINVGSKSHSGLIFLLIGDNVTKIAAGSFSYKIFKFRSMVYKCIKQVYYRNLSFECAGIAEALILGNKDNISNSLLENFRRSGVFHLLAISGLHISILMYFASYIFKKNNFPIILFWLIFIFLLFYNFLIGGRASAWRATIMIVFIVLAGKWNREYNQRIILYFTYILMILSNPYFLYDLGFWLSFGSIAAIVFVSPVLLKFLRKIFPKFEVKRSYIGRTFILSISIQIVLLPIVGHFFGEISIVSAVTNLLVLPAFYIALLLLFIASIFSLIWPPLGGFVLKPASFFIKYILKIVNFFGSIDFNAVRIDNFTIGHMIIYYVVFLSLLIILYRYTIDLNNNATIK